MARRRGRKGDYLASDDYTGNTVFASKLKQDFWGNMCVRPLLRNLQELASPLNDPRPVSMYRGPVYEQTRPCDFEVTPVFIGTTNIPFPQNSPYAQAVDLDPGVGNMEIGCTFIVH